MVILSEINILLLAKGLKIVKISSPTCLNSPSHKKNSESISQHSFWHASRGVRSPAGKLRPQEPADAGPARRATHYHIHRDARLRGAVADVLHTYIDTQVINTLHLTPTYMRIIN